MIIIKEGIEKFLHFADDHMPEQGVLTAPESEADIHRIQLWLLITATVAISITIHSYSMTAIIGAIFVSPLLVRAAGALSFPGTDQCPTWTGSRKARVILEASEESGERKAASYGAAPETSEVRRTAWSNPSDERK